MIPRGLYWRYSGISGVQVRFASAGLLGPATCWLFLVSCRVLRLLSAPGKHGEPWNPA